MSTARHLKPDAVTESLGLIASKLEVMDERQKTDTSAIRGDIARLDQGQAQIIETMNANHIDLNAKLNLILSKLG